MWQFPAQRLSVGWLPWFICRLGEQVQLLFYGCNLQVAQGSKTRSVVVAEAVSLPTLKNLDGSKVCF